MTKTKSSESPGAKPSGGGNGDAAGMAGMAGMWMPPFSTTDSADVERMIGAHRAMVESVLAANRDLLAFMDQRLKADVEVLNRLCHCKDWNELAHVQGNFVATLTRQYFDQAMRMMDTAGKMLAAQQESTKK